jgi:hypothetical protein
MSTIESCVVLSKKGKLCMGSYYNHLPVRLHPVYKVLWLKAPLCEKHFRKLDIFPKKDRRWVEA